MTRRRPLSLIMKTTVSHAALDYAGHPFIFTVGLDRNYGASLEAAQIPANKPLAFLAWVHMWLRLALGLEPIMDGARTDYITLAEPRFHHRQVNPKAVRKYPARNLEALMRFAPDASGLGLTLNQYRERFTRLSFMGRTEIYWAFFQGRPSLHHRVLGRLRLRGAMGLGRGVGCGAPLSPD